MEYSKKNKGAYGAGKPKQQKPAGDRLDKYRAPKPQKPAVVQIDEETEEEKVVGTKGLAELSTNVCADCTSLTEIVLPETIMIIPEYAFNNPGLTVYLPIKEEDAPEGFKSDWHGLSKVVWEYVAPPEEEETDQKDSRRQ